MLSVFTKFFLLCVTLLAALGPNQGFGQEILHHTQVRGTDFKTTKIFINVVSWSDGRQQFFKCTDIRECEIIGKRRGYTQVQLERAHKSILARQSSRRLLDQVAYATPIFGMLAGGWLSGHIAYKVSGDGVTWAGLIPIPDKIANSIFFGGVGAIAGGGVGTYVMFDIWGTSRDIAALEKAMSELAKEQIDPMVQKIIDINVSVSEVLDAITQTLLNIE